MVTRAASAFVLLLLVAGCAANDPDEAAAPAPAPATSSAAPPAGASASPSPSETLDLPSPTAEAGKPADKGAETISGTVTAGVEPNCLLLQSGGKSHLLVFDDQALRSDAKVGAKVTLTGRSEPSMMSTCQQGTPFVVAGVTVG